MSRALAAHGAQVVDADEAARGALAAGSAGAEAVRARFEDVVRSDGSVDRAGLAALVFADPHARADLEAIVHPVVDRIVAAAVDTWRRSSGVVGIVDSPLLVETHGRERYGLDALIVVDAPEDVLVERLVRWRSMSAEDARARIAAQASRAERVRAADFVIPNVGSLGELAQMADEAWRFVESLRRDDDRGGELAGG